MRTSQLRISIVSPSSAMTRLMRSRSVAPVISWSTTTSPRFGSCSRYDNLLTNTRSPSCSVLSIECPSTTKWASTKVRTRNATSSATPMTTTQSRNPRAPATGPSVGTACLIRRRRGRCRLRRYSPTASSASGERRLSPSRLGWAWSVIWCGSAAYSESISFSTRSSRLLNGSLQSTVRCAWSLSFR